MSLKTESAGDASLVKPDPDQDVKMGGDDDEGYEDTGDLEIPQHLPEAWMLRLPQIIYDRWNEIREDEEIQLGELWQYPQAHKWYMMLDDTLKQNQDLPKRSKINVALADKTDDGRPADAEKPVKVVKNTFVFSEQDLPSKRRKAKQEDAPAGGRANGINKYSRFRRSVPKQTKLHAVVKRELTCDATESQAYRQSILRRLREEDKPKMTFEEGDPQQIYADLRLKEITYRSKQTLETSKDSRRRELDSRSVKWEESVLMDRIFDLFKTYKYWRMESIKQHIHQPNDFLRATVQKVADFVKSGPFFNCYALKPEYQFRAVGAQEQSAPEPVEGGDGDGESTEDELSEA